MILSSSLRKANSTLYRQLVFTALAFIAMTVLSFAFMRSIAHEDLIGDANGVLNITSADVLSHRQEFEANLNNFSEIIRIMILQGNQADTLKQYIKGVSEAELWKNIETPNIRNFYGYFETLSEEPVFIYSELQRFPENYNPAASKWYTLAIEASGGIVETVPYISGGEILCTYARCLIDDEGRRLGVICMDVSITAIGAKVVSTAMNQGGYGMLLNQNLLILSHPNKDFVGRYIIDTKVPLSSEIASKLLNGQEILGHPMVSYKSEDVLVFFRKLPNNWYLGLLTPEKQYYAGMTSMTIRLCLLGLTFAVILIIILARLDAARIKSDDENKKKSIFLANMSHEIRTPINAIVGMSAIGRTAGSNERKDYCFAKIDNASKHLLGVISDILDMSKIEANKIELSPSEFIFEKMLQQVVNVVNFPADEKHQKLTVRIDKAIPRVLFADEQRLSQIITNLLSNAVKFTPEKGTISLKASLAESEDADSVTLKVEVTDTGIGISPEQQTRLFQSFQQAESSISRRYGGTGLGLVISKTIVEMMGGTIQLESETGKGSKFTFTVKVKQGESRSFDLNRRGINWKNINILTVDDDPDILSYFREIIWGLGANCDIAANAEEALNLVERHGAYNIYFIDLRMPDVDGISLTKEIRAMEANPENSVVIMISSADLSSVETDAKRAGVNKFLLKPLFPSAIADVISECIGIVGDSIEETPLDICGIFAGHRILFAEDIDINREIILTLLEPTLIEIDCAENGIEAVKHFSRSPGKYDMVFMDIQMPEMDGYEATRLIRTLNFPAAKTVPIIAMTANVFKEDIESCLSAGMNGHLGKPINMDDLIEIMLRYLKKGHYANK